VTLSLSGEDSRGSSTGCEGVLCDPRGTPCVSRPTRYFPLSESLILLLFGGLYEGLYKRTTSQTEERSPSPYRRRPRAARGAGRTPPPYGYTRSSLCSTTPPLYTRFPIIFGGCVPKMAVGFIPRCATSAGEGAPSACGQADSTADTFGRGRQSHPDVAFYILYG
jgi:hypothetical protein